MITRGAKAVNQADMKPVLCHNCGRIIMSLDGFILCPCGCTTGGVTLEPRTEPGFDPDFAATHSSPA